MRWKDGISVTFAAAVIAGAVAVPTISDRVTHAQEGAGPLKADTVYSCNLQIPTDGEGSTPTDYGVENYGGFVTAAVRLAATEQLQGGTLGYAVPTYFPRTRWRKIKQSINIYLNPGVSVQTQSAIFVDAITASRVWSENDNITATLADLSDRQEISLAVAVGGSVVQFTPDLANHVGMGKNYDAIMSYIFRNPKDGQNCGVTIGYLVASDNPALQPLLMGFDPGETREVVTWDYQAHFLPNGVAQDLIAISEQ